MAVSAQVGRDHSNITQPRRERDEAQAVRLDAVQTQQWPAVPELRNEERRGRKTVHGHDCRR